MHRLTAFDGVLNYGSAVQQLFLVNAPMSRMLSLSRFALGLGLFAALTACMTTRGYERTLERYFGMPEIDLVRQWGTPARVHTVGDSRFLTFRRSEQVLEPFGPMFVGPVYTRQGLFYPLFYPPERTVERWCATTFELQKNVVVAWRYEGNDCLARNR